MMVCVQNPTCTKCTWWPWWPIWLLISHLVRRAAHLDRRLRPVWHRVQAQQQTFEGKTCAQSIFGGGWYCFESRNTHLWGLLYNCEWLILFSSSSNNNYLFIWYYFFIYLILFWVVIFTCRDWASKAIIRRRDAPLLPSPSPFWSHRPWVCLQNIWNIWEYLRTINPAPRVSAKYLWYMKY